MWWFKKPSCNPSYNNRKPMVKTRLVREDEDGYRLEYIEMEVFTSKENRQSLISNTASWKVPMNA